MENNDDLMIKYVAVWGWQILSVLFIVATFIILSFDSSLFSIVSAVAFFILFGFCQYKVFARRRDLNEK